MLQRMYKIQEENSIEVMEECLSMGREYYNEVESKSEVLPYNINPQPLEQLINAGMLWVITVRNEDGELLGFSSLLVTEDFLNQEYGAKEFCLYIKPEHRGGRAYIKLMRFIEDLCRLREIRTVVIGFKIGHNEQLAEKMGYEHTESIYQKILEA